MGGRKTEITREGREGNREHGKGTKRAAGRGASKTLAKLICTGYVDGRFV
jgi:hypothetical protein